MYLRKWRKLNCGFAFKGVLCIIFSIAKKSRPDERKKNYHPRCIFVGFPESPREVLSEYVRLSQVDRNLGFEKIALECSRSSRQKRGFKPNPQDVRWLPYADDGRHLSTIFVVRFQRGVKLLLFLFFLFLPSRLRMAAKSVLYRKKKPLATAFFLRAFIYFHGERFYFLIFKRWNSNASETDMRAHPSSVTWRIDLLRVGDVFFDISVLCGEARSVGSAEVCVYLRLVYCLRSGKSLSLVRVISAFG